MVFFGFPRVFLFFFGFGSSKTKKKLGKFWFFGSWLLKNQKKPR